MIKDWLETYHPNNQEDYTQALREIMQQIALAGLYRAGFFQKAAFYGGTALRIFYGLNRYSEDLDFSLLEKNTSFHFTEYLKAVKNEFDALGMNISISTKEKTFQSDIESAFLKSETLWSELTLQAVLPQVGLKQTIGLKIKLEIDTHPPLGFETEEKLLLQPFSFYIRCFQIQDLFAGKMHALLFRKWKNNVKGRDWYDFEWYVRRGTPLNLHHFALRAFDSGDWKKDAITEIEFRQLLKKRIDEVNINRVKTDIKRFISHPESLDIWSAKYFHDLADLLKVYT